MRETHDYFRKPGSFYCTIDKISCIRKAGINSGDAQSLQILDSFANNIAAQIINIQCIFDPEKISIGGGISEQPILIEYINKNLQEQYNSIDFYMPKIEVEKCTFCNDSNLIGALYNFKCNV